MVLPAVQEYSLSKQIDPLNMRSMLKRTRYNERVTRKKKQF